MNGPRNRRSRRARRAVCRRRPRGDRIVDLDSRISDVTQAPPDIFSKTAFEQAANDFGSGLRHRAPVGLALDHVRERVGQRVARERPTAGQHLIEHAAERPDVRALVDRLAPRLLRTHVRRGPQNDALVRAVGRPGWQMRRIDELARARFRQSEVQHFHDAIGSHLDIGRLQIAMNDPFSCAASSASQIWRAMASACAGLMPRA